MTNPLPSPWPPGYTPAEAPAAAPAVPEPPAPAPVIPRCSKTGRILPGGPGGPGRPAGKLNRATLAAQESMQGLVPAATSMLAALISQGNFAAVKFVLERFTPSERTIELTSAADPNAVIEMAAAGELTPAEANRLAQAWKTTSDAVELRDLKARLDEMENLILQLKR